MLSTRTDVAPQGEYYADSLLKVPSTSQSVFDNLSMGVATPFMAINILDGAYAQRPEGQAVQDSIEALQLENNTPGMSTSQYIIAQGANMLGMMLNPATWALGEAGGVAAKGAVAGVRGVAAASEGGAMTAATALFRKPLSELVGKKVGQYVPSTIGKGLAEKDLTIGLIGEKAAENFGTFAGAGVPQAITDNYKADTDHIEWGGVAREMGEMGAFGIAIGSIPFGYGVLRGKINRGLGKEPTDIVGHGDLDQALHNGHISEAEHKWYTDYLEHQQNPGDTKMSESLRDRASEIINNNGHRANTVTNEAMFEMLSHEDMQNLQGVIADQVSGGVPEEYNKALSDFVIHDRMDKITEKPEMLDGVRGYVDFINGKLEKRAAKSAEADKILDDHLEKGVKENMPFSQKGLLKHMRQAGFEASHMKQLPVTIPEQLTKHLAGLEKINRLKTKLRREKRKGLPENKQVLRRIADLEAKLPRVLTPKEELRHLRDRLLTNGLPKNFERSPEYHRLVDLSHAWRNARTLLDRVHLEAEYERQKSFRDLSHQILNIADSDQTRIAKPENVTDYLKRRIEGNLNRPENIADVQRAVDERQNVPADAETILTEQQAQLEKSTAEDSKKEFDQSVARIKEFKQSEGIFKNLISCVLGGIGG